MDTLFERDAALNADVRLFPSSARHSTRVVFPFASRRSLPDGRAQGSPRSL